MTIHDVTRFGIGTKSGTEVLIVFVGVFHEEGKGGVNNKTIKSTHLVKKKKFAISVSSHFFTLLLSCHIFGGVAVCSIA